MKKRIPGTMLLSLLAVFGLTAIVALKSDVKKHNNYNLPDAGNAGLTLPSGFSAAIIADNLGSARHITVTPQNEIYVKLRGPEHGKGILLLHQNGDKADVKASFGTFGGT